MLPGAGHRFTNARMSDDVELRRLIARTERMLPGRPAPEGMIDDRWQMMMRIEDFIPGHPEPVWDFVRKWARHPQEDLRTAVAVVLLEHLLEQHFDLIYRRVRDEVRASKRFLDTLQRCWWLGQAALPANAGKLDRLAGRKRRRVFPRKGPKPLMPPKTARPPGGR